MTKQTVKAILQAGEITTVDKHGNTVVLIPTESLYKTLARWWGVKKSQEVPRQVWVDYGELGYKKRKK